jgi:predicted ester cyclase
VDGRAGALVVEGAAGIGKTHLVQALAEEARSRDVTVCYGRAHPFERTRPFGVVAASLDLRRRSPDRRRAAVGALLAGEGAGAGGQPGGDFQYRVVEEVVDLVESACAEHAVRGYRAAFRDMRMDVIEVLPSGDRTVARVKVSGTQTGDFMGLPASGRHAEVDLIDIMRFDDAGLVSEHWGVADMLSLLQQLGAIPAGAATA